MTEHILVVVGLEDEVSGAGHVARDRVRRLADVRGDHQAVRAAGDEVSDAVAAVVRDLEGLDGEIADGEGHAFFDHAPGGAEGLVDVSTAVDAGVHAFGGVDRDMAAFAEAADGLDVVAVVVGDEHGQDAFEVDVGLAERLTDGAQSDAGVDEDAVVSRAHVVAVATTAAGQTHEAEGHSSIDDLCGLGSNSLPD